MRLLALWSLLAAPSLFLDRLGELHDDQCGAAGDSGILRWSPAKIALQVCDGAKAKWNSAGGGTLDAAEAEPCSADIKGQLQWDNAESVLSVCSAPAGEAAEWLAVYTKPLPEPEAECQGCTKTTVTIGGDQFLIFTFLSNGAFTAPADDGGSRVSYYELRYRPIDGEQDEEDEVLAVVETACNGEDEEALPGGMVMVPVMVQ